MIIKHCKEVMIIIIIQKYTYITIAFSTFVIDTDSMTTVC